LMNSRLTGVLFFSVLILSACIFSSLPVSAETTIGCPLGMEEDQLWVRTMLQMVDMTEKYDRQSDRMVPLPDGWHKQVRTSGFRLGYGLTDQWEVGLLLTEKAINQRKFNKKTKTWTEIHDGGIGDVWLALGYKFLEEEDWGGFDEVYMKLGLGYKSDVLQTLSDREILHGVGNGAREMKLVFLSHEVLGKLAFCNHLVYHWRGSAPVIPGSKLSGQNLTDRLNYKFNLEYELSEEWVASVGLFGWMDVQKISFAGKFKDKGMDGQKAHMHRLVFSLEKSLGEDKYGHKKLKLAYGIPYSVKNGMAPNYDIMLIAMYTWP